MIDSSVPPSLSQALLRGFAGRCPACGEAKLFARFLKPVAHCPHCGESWAERRADDFPAYLVILVLGHLIVPVIVMVNLDWQMPMMLQMILWPLLTCGLALAAIQPTKGAVLGLMWAR